MRARLLAIPLSLYLALALLACTKPPATNDASTGTNATDANTKGSNGFSERRESREARQERRPQPLIVAAGTSISITLDSALGSKISEAGSKFYGSTSRDVMVGNEVAIPRGTDVEGTVEDAKPLGRFKGGAVLRVRLDAINLNGNDLPLATSMRSFSEKGKGKRTAVLTGGGAALGGIIGALAGGGKGAAIGLAAGAGAGAGGSAFTGNKEIVLPAESELTFELSQDLEVRQ
jgi:hypothetical protein